MVNSTTARRAKVISLVESGAIHSQADLVKELKKSGYKVTQATASRDLEEVGAVRGSHGYQLANSSDDSLSRVLTTEKIDHQCRSLWKFGGSSHSPGGAQLLASNLDHAGIKSIIGTIAGDDTVMVVSRKSKWRCRTCERIARLGE
jgi:transcriptional regulator of arginine metabolism